MQEPPARPKRRTPWLLGAVVLLLLTFLILLQTSNLWRNLAIESAEDTIALWALSSLNFLAFVIFAFIFVRNIIKLVRERRTSEVGSKIKSKLLTYFVAISILPIIAMAVFSSLFMNRALERWFTQIVAENVFKAAKDVEKQALANQMVKLNQTARMLAASLENQEVTEKKLAELVRQGNLTEVLLVAKDGRILLSNERELSPEKKAELDKTIDLLNKGNFNEPSLNDGRGFDAGIGFFADGRRLVVIPDLYSEETISQVVEKSRSDFEALKNRETSIRQMGFSILGLLTFLLIFASTWTAFYVARGLTVPIKALAEGADEIARGNLKYRVNVAAEDELALLVGAFNQMSSKLEENSTELQERRRYIETVLQSLSTGVISFDAQNRMTTINRAAVRMLKLEEESFQLFPLANLVGSGNREILEKLINRAKRTGQASEQTVLQRERTDANNGAEENMPVALTATALPGAGGIVLVIEDLSELLQAQRASAWSEVARRMAHEIKNPLTPIQLSAERIAKRFTDSQNSKSKVQSFLDVFKTKNVAEKTKTEEQTVKVIRDGTETILREVSSLKAMVDEFSRFARLPNAKLEIGDLNEIIRQSARLYEDRGAQIETDLAVNLPKTMLDEEQLKRVFVNLIENAVEAFDQAQENKKVTVKTFYDKGRDLIVAEVSDNGSGITPSDFQKLFQPYFSTKGRGTGLGLAIVQRIIADHGGKIKAVNNSPRGAKFIVELPLAN